MQYFTVQRDIQYFSFSGVDDNTIVIFCSDIRFAGGTQLARSNRIDS
jgi:hypothetical protein